MSRTPPGERGFGDPTRRNPRVEVSTRDQPGRSRTAPRMRLDLLQIIAWAEGLTLVTSGLVALARMGFDELTLLEPVVPVGGLPATPLLALLLVLVGAALLALATGVVDERSLRVVGVVFGVVGTVWTIEPDAFTPYLGIEASNGVAALVMGIALVVASFVPPLSVARPGVR